MSRPLDIHYLDHQIFVRLSSRTSPEAKKAGLILLKNVLFNRTLSFPFFFSAIWVLPRYVSGCKLLRPLNKFLSLTCSQSLLKLNCFKLVVCMVSNRYRCVPLEIKKYFTVPCVFGAAPWGISAQGLGTSDLFGRNVSMGKYN